MAKPKKPIVKAKHSPARKPPTLAAVPESPTKDKVAPVEEAEPPVKFEPEPGDEVKPGEVDAMGNYYLEEVDFLRLQARKERRDACKVQAEALRVKAELLQLKLQTEHARFLNQAASFDRAATAHETSIQESLTELSKKYDIDFKDKTVRIDEEVGRIIATDPTKGLPRLSKPEG